MRDAAAELDDFEPAADIAFGFFERLAVFLCDELDQLIKMRVHQLAIPEQDCRALCHRRVRPRDERLCRCFGGLIDFYPPAHRRAADDFARRRVVHVAELGRFRRGPPAVDEDGDDRCFADCC